MCIRDSVRSVHDRATFPECVDHPAGQVGHHWVLVGGDPLHHVPLGTGDPGEVILQGKF